MYAFMVVRARNRLSGKELEWIGILRWKYLSLEEKEGALLMFVFPVMDIDLRSILETEKIRENCTQWPR